MTKPTITLDQAKIMLSAGISAKEISEKYDGFKKMQLAGYLAAMNRGKKTAPVTKLEITPVQERDNESTNDSQQDILTEAKARALIMRGCNPKKIAEQYAGKTNITEGTMIAWRAHVQMDTYTKNPALLNGTSKKRAAKPEYIETMEEFMPLLKENKNLRDLSLLALGLGEDSRDIEETIMQIYQGKFRNRDELHRLIRDSREQIAEVLNNGLTNLGAFIGRYSLVDSAMAPVILEPAINAIPFASITPKLEKLLLRVANGVYDPLFNKNPQETLDNLRDRENQSTGQAKQVYSLLIAQYEGALRVGEYLRSLGKIRETPN